MKKWILAIIAICLISTQPALASNAKVAEMAMYLSTKVDKENAAILRRVAEVGYIEETPMKSWGMLQSDLKKMVDGGLPKELTEDQQKALQKFMPQMTKLMNQFLASELILRSKNAEESKKLSAELPTDATKWRAGIVNMVTEMLKVKEMFPGERDPDVDLKAEAEETKLAISLILIEFGLSHSQAWTLAGSPQIGLTFFRQAYSDVQTVAELDLKRQCLQRIALFGVIIDPKTSKAAFEQAAKCYGEGETNDAENAKEFQRNADFICSLIRLGITGKFEGMSNNPLLFSKNEKTPAKIEISQKDLAKLIQETKSRAVSERPMELTMAMVALIVLKAVDKSDEAVKIADTLFESLEKSGDDTMGAALIIMTYNLDEKYFLEKSKTWLEANLASESTETTLAGTREFLETIARNLEGKEPFDDELATWARAQFKEKGGGLEEQTILISLLSNVVSKKQKISIDADVDQRLRTLAKEDPEEMDFSYAFMASTNTGVDNARAKMFIDKLLPKKGEISEDKKELIDQLCQAMSKMITNPIKSLDPLDMGF